MQLKHGFFYRLSDFLFIPVKIGSLLLIKEKKIHGLVLIGNIHLG